MSTINLSLYHDAGFSTAELRSLEALLSVQPLHWITLNENGIYELILDNQMFSCFRQCPSHFMELYVNGYVPRGNAARSWFLEFGILFHKMIEIYYVAFRQKDFDVSKWAIDQAVNEWNKADLDFHKEHKEYKLIGGVQGFCGLLLSYATRYAAENERLRVIGAEIAFGKGKEVLLGCITPNLGIPEDIIEMHKQFPNAYIAWGTNRPPTDTWLQVFLSGRLDLLVDDGNAIAPMDHKTMGSFRFDPASRFEVDEGPTGYVFSVNQILPQIVGSDVLKRSCNKIIMNFISKAIPKEGERFKRLSILKTTEQLESYRLRMLATAEDLFRALVRYAHSGYATRDTSKCTNWAMRDCMYFPVHRQNSKASELLVLNSFYDKKPIWNTEMVGKEEGGE